MAKMRKFENIESDMFIISYFEIEKNLFKIILQQNKTDKFLDVESVILRLEDGKISVKELIIDGDFDISFKFQTEIFEYLKKI